VENATAVIWKRLLIAEKTFRRLDSPELLADVASGVVYVNGVRAVNRRSEGVAPDFIYTLLDKTSLAFLHPPLALCHIGRRQQFATPQKQHVLFGTRLLLHESVDGAQRSPKLSPYHTPSDHAEFSAHAATANHEATTTK
jgi:hypothetical protein